MTEQCVKSLNYKNWKCAMNGKLEWRSNARWMEIRMTKQCAINGN